MAEPMYRRIAEDLRHQIEAGDLQPGQQLRTELELREVYGTSRSTVRDAMKLLATLGLVESRPGQGIFVVQKITPFITTLTADSAAGGVEETVYLAEAVVSGREPAIVEPRVETQEAIGFVAGALGIEEGTPVVSRYQERFIDGSLWSLQTSYYSLDLVSRGAHRLLEASDIPEGTVTYLRETLGLVQIGWRDSITVRPPNAEERRLFGLSDGLSMEMFEFRRVGLADDEADPGTSIPFRVTVTVHPVSHDSLFGPPRILVVDPGRAPAEFVVPA